MSSFFPLAGTSAAQSAAPHPGTSFGAAVFCSELALRTKIGGSGGARTRHANVGLVETELPSQGALQEILPDEKGFEEVVRAWPKLPAHAKAAIRSIIDLVERGAV